ncbi:hypothetical protein F4677DRAFT_315076 [Hypoxylon crocopeplum]|nr:hypothetical protein F4677DRAFT_315076 [Hypoxylon crocopeplum]
MSSGSAKAKQYTTQLINSFRANSLAEIQSILQRARTESPEAYSGILRDALWRALYRACSPEIIRHLVMIEHAPIDTLSPSVIARSASIPVLDILLSHGWDVNRSGNDGETIIYYVLHDEALVRWLVDRGADIELGDIEYLANGRFIPRPPLLLEACAERGSFASFKILLEKGAKLSRRVLHCASHSAAESGADPASPESERWSGEGAEGFARRKERGQILRYLVEEQELDVNQMDSDIPAQMHWGTPINYAAKARHGIGVVKWLLSKGADPTIKGLDSGMDAEGIARTWAQSEEIVDLVKAWKRESGIRMDVPNMVA